MQETRWLWLVLLALSVSAPPVAAQPPAKPTRPYVQLDFDADPDHLADRIKKAGQLEKYLKNLVEDARKHPEKYQDFLKANNFNNPELKRQLQRNPLFRDVLKNLAADARKNPQDFKAIQELLKKEKIDVPKEVNVLPGEKLPLEKPPGDKQPVNPPSERKPLDNAPVNNEKPPDAAKITPPAVPNAEEQEQYAQWAEEFLKRLDRTALGERLANSEAWQQSRHRLEGLFADKKFGDLRLKPEALQGMTERLKLDGWRPKWDADRPTFDAAPKPWQDMPRPNFAPPGGNPFNAGSGVGPGGVGAAPGLPGGAATAGLAFVQMLLWVAVLVAVVAVIVFVLRRNGFTLGRRGAPAALPAEWPYQPHLIATRAELIAAFEYLSLLLLGPGARTWNHKDIAVAVGGPAAPERRHAADELAALYEQARYTPDDGPLTPAAVAAARRDLCLLAGVSHA